MTSYDMTIRVVGEDKLATIISALKGAGTLLTIEPVRERKPSRSRVAIEPRHRETGTTGKELLLEALAATPTGLNTKQLQAIFVAKGRAKNSASPQLSACKAEGLIINDAPEHYKIVKGK